MRRHVSNISAGFCQRDDVILCSPASVWEHRNCPETLAFSPNFAKKLNETRLSLPPLLNESDTEDVSHPPESNVYERTTTS